MLHAGRSFIQRHLDPASRLGEVLFGLIMVLTFTLTAATQVDQGVAGVRQLLIATLGCNFAWGLIDAVMYIMSCMVNRAATKRLLTKLHSTTDENAGVAVLKDELDTTFDLLADEPKRNAVAKTILSGLTHRMPQVNSIRAEDIYGGVCCFGLVFISCFPGAVPFLFLSDPQLALRASNLALIIMLYIVGQKWGEYANTNRILSGSAMVIIGLSLVGIAIAFGG